MKKNSVKETQEYLEFQKGMNSNKKIEDDPICQKIIDKAEKAMRVKSI